VELGAVGGQAVQRLVGQLATGGQVQRLNVTAVGGEAAEGRVTNILTTLEAEALEKAATSLGQVLNHSSLNVNLELKQVNLLPVGAVKSQHIPWFAHLSTSAEADDVKVGEDPEEQLPGQPPVDESLIVLGEDPGDLPLGDPHLNWVTIPIP